MLDGRMFSDLNTVSFKNTLDDLVIDVSREYDDSKSHKTRHLSQEKTILAIGHDRYLTYVVLIFMMSDKSEGNENIETAQKNQKKIGAAEDDP